MTPQQALEFIDNLLGQINLTREQHGQVGQAVAIVRSAIQPEAPE